MNVDFDYLRNLLFQIETGGGDLIIPNTLDRDITKESCAQILLNKGYLYTVNEQCYCLTEPGYDFLDLIRDESAWATLKSELAISGNDKIGDLITLVESKIKLPSDDSRVPSITGKEMDISTHNRNSHRKLDFISYSHKDKQALDRLHTHLAVLRREHHINEWYDREILAGDDFDQEISEQLETCELFLALVSPDYLASGYCYEREMTRALERHHAGVVRVVPIIIEPCDWKETPLGRLKALPHDGKPVSTWENENEAYLNVVIELRRILTQENQDNEVAHTSPSEQNSAPPPVGRRYRVKREFDEIDRSQFRDQAFSNIRSFIESEMANIDGHEGLRGLIAVAGEQSFSCTLVNKNRSHGTAKITVNKGGRNIGMGDIYYSFSEYSPLNSVNGIFSIEADEYELHLTPILTGLFDERRQRLTPEDAAKLIWRDFLEQAGVSYDC